MPRTKSQPERPQAEKMSKATGGTSAKAGGAGEAFMTTKVTGGTSAKAGGAGETLKTTKAAGGTSAKVGGAGEALKTTRTTGGTPAKVGGAGGAFIVRPQAEGTPPEATSGTSAKAVGAGRTSKPTEDTSGTSAKAVGAGRDSKPTEATSGISAKAVSARRTSTTSEKNGGTSAKAVGAGKSSKASHTSYPMVNDEEETESNASKGPPTSSGISLTKVRARKISRTETNEMLTLDAPISDGQSTDEETNESADETSVKRKRGRSKMATVRWEEDSLSKYENSDFLLEPMDEPTKVPIPKLEARRVNSNTIRSQCYRSLMAAKTLIYGC